MNSSLESRVQKDKQKQRVWMITSTLVVTLFAGYQFYTQSIPYLAEKIATAIPEPIYRIVDESSLEALDESEFSHSQLDVNKQKEVQTLFLQLVENEKAAHRQFTLALRHWQGQANAMALANGSVIITDAMVNLTANPQELSAILLHEIGHVKHNHVMESIVSSSIVFAGLSVIFGDISALSDMILQGTMTGVTQSYSRHAELEADRYAAQQLTALYGSHEAMTEIFKKLNKQHPDGPSWLSTHPSFGERIEKLTKSKLAIE
ncbi:peptidase M48 [Pseudoalteromonas sp. MSK9-3]|uniref:M48 family metallopeptidase n=1 Tax=Pseudoalteromonas sp. MSK9-3 TaxID=1897633 RepID=UPI000E6B70B5|nr:M48 family metallopeptidase [Pseudoalteromonas sp. MSK9-3]RJE76964.1 peptidase M48 [Pseudoalteromonas sp. MSK9-3]